MPTNKPILQVVIEEEIYEEFRRICEKESCKMSSKAKEIIIEYMNKQKEDIKEQIKYHAEKLYNLTKETTP